MGFIVYLGKMLKIKVSINLCRADVGMSEQFLYRAEVAAGFQQVGRKAVPEQMWVDPLRQSRFARPALDACLYAARADPAAPRSDEQRVFLRAGQICANPQPA